MPNDPHAPFTQATGYATAHTAVEAAIRIVSSRESRSPSHKDHRAMVAGFGFRAYETNSDLAARVLLWEVRRLRHELSKRESHNNESSVTPHEARKETK